MTTQTRSYTFNFRKMTVADFTGSYSKEDLENQNFLAQFDTVDEDGKPTNVAEAIKGYRRKPVTVELTMPEFLSAIPEESRETVASILEGTIAAYVKNTWIDQFKPLEPYTWADIQTALATRGGRGKQWDFSDGTLANAAKHFGSYCAQSLGNSEAGGRMEKIAAGKFSRSAVTRQADAFDETILKKLLGCVERWAEYCAEHDEDAADEYASVYDCWTASIDRHLRSDYKKFDLSSVL